MERGVQKAERFRYPRLGPIKDMLFSDRSQRERQEVGDEAGNLLNSARKHRVWQTARTARDLLALVSRGGRLRSIKTLYPPETHG
jgi:hypothetical protein